MSTGGMQTTSTEGYGATSMDFGDHDIDIDVKGIIFFFVDRR